MCGVFATTDSDVFSSQFCQAALAASTNRGPDSEGFCVDDGKSFGHTRLAIIGLGDAGAQPFGDRERGILVYNGEIYNYQEIAAALSIKPDSDTHVLYEILARGRTDLLERLRGMYAFVYWNPRDHTLTTARDPFGIKPLYQLEHQNGQLTFASTPAALAQHPDARDIDSQALLHFLATGFFREGTSIFQRISKLPPGLVHTYTQQNSRWSLTTHDIPLSGWDRLETSTALANSVSAHMVADVEVGVLLSGGVDSTLIAAMAARENANLRSYSLVNPRAPSLDEGPLARWNAGLIGTHHTEVPATPELLAAQVDALVKSTAEPFGDPAYLALSLLSERVAQDVKVTLAGEGADELYGGYRRYDIERLASRRATASATRLAAITAARLTGAKNKLPTSMRRTILSLARKPGYDSHLLLMASEWATITAAFPDAGAAGHASALHDWESVADGDWALDLPPNRAFDLRRWLPNIFLEKSDRASMLHSLEVRTPFLDPVVATSARNQPEPTDSRKQPLRDELFRLLPNVRLPEKKMGLGVDIPALLDAGLGELADGQLHDLDSPLHAAGIEDRSGLLADRAETSPGLRFRIALLGAWAKHWR
jgi:asparagine synthase (glutamine-hydrolysing)